MASKPICESEAEALEDSNLDSSEKNLNGKSDTSTTKADSEVESGDVTEQVEDKPMEGKKKKKSLIKEGESTPKGKAEAKKRKSSVTSGDVEKKKPKSKKSIDKNNEEVPKKKLKTDSKIMKKSKSELSQGKTIKITSKSAKKQKLSPEYVEKLKKALKEMSVDQFKKVLVERRKFHEKILKSERREKKKKAAVQRAQKSAKSTKFVSKDTDIPLSDNKIGFIGHGEKGKEILKTLANANLKLVLWDEKPESIRSLLSDDISEVGSANELINTCDVIVWCAPSLEASEDIFFRHLALKKLISGKYLIDLTNSPPMSPVHMYNTARLGKGHYLEARVSGSFEDISKGNAIIYSSGDEKAFDAASPVFKALSSKAYYLGAVPGKASRVALMISSFQASCIVSFEKNLKISGTSRTDLEEFCKEHGAILPEAASHIYPDDHKTLQDLKKDLQYFLFSEEYGMLKRGPNHVIGFTTLYYFNKLEKLLKNIENTPLSIETPD